MVLVLAIAGLIFLIVFLALPDLQRSRRDTQRKSNAQQVLALATSYASNNGGVYPCSENTTYCHAYGSETASWTSFADDYLAKSNLVDPSSGTYNYHDNTQNLFSLRAYAIGYPTNSSNAHGDFRDHPDYKPGFIYLWDGAYCDSDRLVHTGSDEQTNIAVIIKLESAPNYCVDNS